MPVPTGKHSINETLLAKGWTREEIATSYQNDFPELPAHLQDKNSDDREWREWVYYHWTKPCHIRQFGKWQWLPDTFEEYEQRYLNHPKPEINPKNVETILTELNSKPQKHEFLGAILYLLEMLINAIKSLMAKQDLDNNDALLDNRSPQLSR
ncbi:MAG: hypothetical protein KDH94_06640 [Coxiellaceae bacterium]|nr:hypothetical protein [Coxiellaceae bacterium]